MSFHSRKTWRYVMTIIGLGLSVICSAQFGGGSGTEEDPWQIATPNHLENIRDYCSAIHGNKFFIQTADIDLDVPPYNEGLGWLSLGFSNVFSFRGSYDGNGFVINGLYINRPDTVFHGLFGWTFGANIINVSLTDVNITARGWAGALAGRNIRTTIENSYSSGIISGTNRIGGLTGTNEDGSTIKNCYSSVRVTAHREQAGGISGVNNAGCTIDRCYSSGVISAPRTSGGLIGMGNDDDVTNSFWDIEISGQQRSAGGEGLNTAEMLQQESYREWSFTDIWQIEETVSYPFFVRQESYKIDNLPIPVNLKTENNYLEESIVISWEYTGTPSGYNLYRDGSLIGQTNHPVKEWSDRSVEPYRRYSYYVKAVHRIGDMLEETGRSKPVRALYHHPFAGGSGTEEDPWQIDNCEQLYNLRYYTGSEHSDKYFIQSDDIDLYNSPYSEGQGWNPIGSDMSSFQGSYDGNGFVIDGLFINRRNSSIVGLFGVCEYAEIKNSGLINVNVTGEATVGGLVAEGYRLSVKNSFVTGKVKALEGYAGGLVAVQYNSTITNCHSKGYVESTRSRAGGLVGLNANNSTIRNSYSTCNVTADNQGGGLVGLNGSDSIIRNSFSTGTVTGERFVGGLVGTSYTGNIDNSYSTSPVKGIRVVGGLVGHSYSSLISNSYSTGSVVGRESSGGLVGVSERNSVITDCYWNIQTSGLTESAGGTGKTVIEMIRQETYEEYDFDDIWRIDETVSYPYFDWQQTAWHHNVPGPFNLTAEIDIEFLEVYLTWNVKGESLRYLIYRDNKHVHTVNYPLMHWTDTDLSIDGSYTYFVKAVRIIDDEEIISSRSNEVSVLLGSYFASGTGTGEDPWEIATAEHLNNIRYFTGDMHSDKHFIQTADIDLERFSPESAVNSGILSDGKGWIPISTSDIHSFQGVYDGNGYTIRNLFIDRPDRDNQSLFGHVSQGTIRNLILKNVDVQGQDNTAAIASQGYHIQFLRCSVSGVINGNTRVGGIIANAGSNSFIEECNANVELYGYNMIGGICGHGYYVTINNSYATGIITGTLRAGGIIGFMERSAMNNSYSTASVSGNSLTGGLIGYREEYQENINNCYWNTETSGHSSSFGGTGLNTWEMMRAGSFTNYDFTFIWQIEEGETFPYLRWQESPENNNIPGAYNLSGTADYENISVELAWEVINEPSSYRIYRDDGTGFSLLAQNEYPDCQYIDNDVERHHSYSYYVQALFSENDEEREVTVSNRIKVIIHTPFAGGDGTADNPWYIANAEQLNNMRIYASDKEKHFLQTADINLNQPPWNEGEGWIPIGTDGSSTFNSNFDGNGFSINGLYINRPTNNKQGLFGMVRNGFIKNVTLTNVNITGNTYVGGLSGVIDASSHIYGSSVTGEIVANEYAGGLAGSNLDGSVIDSCFTEIDISGIHHIGGFLGMNNFADVYNSWSSGSVKGNSYIGGFAGGNIVWGKIIGCYNEADVIANGNNAGGIAGRQYYARIHNSHNTGNITGQGYVGGITGHNNQSCRIIECYNLGNITGESNVAGIAGRSYENSRVENSFNRGNIRANGNVGGIAGLNMERSVITHSYSTGLINGYLYRGALSGVNYYAATVVQSYWNQQTTGITVGAGIPRTTDQMTYPYDDCYIFWDFDNIWKHDIDHSMNDGYPYLEERIHVTIDDLPVDVQRPVTLYNYPNPFNPDTNIKFHIPQRGNVKLQIFNIKGQRVKTLADDMFEAGTHKLIWDGRNEQGQITASGIYFYRLQTERETITKKMMLLK